MFKFLLGVLVGAAAVWIYQFFKGDDVSWEQPFSTSGATSYSGSTSSPVGSSFTTSGAEESSSPSGA